MLDKTFDPAAAEPRLYDAWEKAGAFQPSDSPEGFSIVIPPPNVTGSLHMGHALNNTLQDVLTRFKRMQGKAALWLPGTDHAGIATQMVVERQLEQEGTSRRSTTFCVAMPAWSVPGIQSASRPCMRRQRISTSCSVLFSPCPMWSMAVTFGGGMTMV